MRWKHNKSGNCILTDGGVNHVAANLAYWHWNVRTEKPWLCFQTNLSNLTCRMSTNKKQVLPSQTLNRWWPNEWGHTMRYSAGVVVSARTAVSKLLPFPRTAHFADIRRWFFHCQQMSSFICISRVLLKGPWTHLFNSFRFSEDLSIVPYSFGSHGCT